MVEKGGGSREDSSFIPKYQKIGQFREKHTLTCFFPISPPYSMLNTNTYTQH